MLRFSCFADGVEFALVKLLACGHNGIMQLAYPDWGFRGFSGVLTGVSLGGLQEIFAPPRQVGSMSQES